MTEHFEHTIISLLAGLFLGMLFAITIRYPLKLDDIKKYQAFCGTQTITNIRVGFSGSIYAITCDNGLTIKVH